MFFGYFCTPQKQGDDLVAQLVEHNTFNVGALGSSPSGITTKPPQTEAFLLPAFLKYVCNHKQ